jgi:hypothetical protein
MVVAGESSPALSATAKFASAVGGRVVSDYVNEYLRQPAISRASANEVYRTNREMAQNGGFTDISQSVVYSPEEGYFFYTARTPDQVSTCAAFFDLARAEGSRRVSLLDGVTLIGVSEAAKQLASKRSVERARDVFLPREKIGDGVVGRQSTYYIYRSDAAVVRADYRNEGEGKGRVIVEAKNEHGALLGGGTYNLTYR